VSHKPKIAVVGTVYRPASHCDVIVSRWIKPLDSDAIHGWTNPKSTIASMFIDQFPENDMAVETCKRHEIPLYKTIEEALCLGGTSLAVDGVLLIGEHGDYPFNSIGQKLYPRKEFFDAIVRVFRRSGRVVPIFCDKHLSWNSAWALEMAATIRELQIPFMGGSTIPHAPWLPNKPTEPWPDRVDEVVAVFHDSIESYLFHSTEVTSVVLENQAGGHPGIRSVQTYREEAFWNAMDAGVWSKELMDQALAINTSTKEGDPRTNCKSTTPPVIAFCLELTNGTRVTHLLMHGQVRGFSVAARIGKQETYAGMVKLEGTSTFHGHFAKLNSLIEQMILIGKSPVRLERTLRNSLITAACVQALAEPMGRLETPQLENFSHEMDQPSRT
jgi:hypothetical protein